MLKTICENSHEKKTGILSQFGLEKVRMMEYISKKSVDNLPRLPLEGSLDLTYRCNNNCRHCWLWIPPDSPEAKKELSLDEIKGIVDEARSLGCRKWFISGGEPMLRPDFEEIFDYISSRAASYTINTNGTLITPKIARMMRRKGTKLIAIYGATAEVHDHITRNPGSFDALKQGISYLKEARTAFTVQIIPMKDNYFQYQDMISLAESLSPYCRIGAAWLYLSAYGNAQKNREILNQRLEPACVVEVNRPDFSDKGRRDKEPAHKNNFKMDDDRLFAACISGRRSFHIDPYGQMSFCSFVKSPELRFDLKKGSLKEGWEEFIPSLADKVLGDKEYFENCGPCESRNECRWCAVYGFLEKERHSARVEYLCEITAQAKKQKENWQKNHRRFFQVAGITLQVEADLPITEDTYHPKFKLFEVDKPGEDIISIRHHFSLPVLTREDFGEELYRRSPWAVYQKNGSWIYEVFTPHPEGDQVFQITFFSHDFTRAKIYNHDEYAYRKGNNFSLTLFSSDQILLAQVLADRQACFFHSSGVILDGKGLLFIGHSDAGKSTMVKLIKEKAEILCDERIIVRRWPEGFKIHGNWAHGEVPEVSASSAPLKAIFFLEQSTENRIFPIEDKQEKIRRLLACLIKPFDTVDWWSKMLALTDTIVREVPCFSLHFNMNGDVVKQLEDL
jgi:MoaA/NifB/PqqE/SkfB family radical SAM enzyme